MFQFLVNRHDRGDFMLRQPSYTRGLLEFGPRAQIARTGWKLGARFIPSGEKEKDLRGGSSDRGACPKQPMDHEQKTKVRNISFVETSL